MDLFGNVHLLDKALDVRKKVYNARIQGQPVNGYVSLDGGNMAVHGWVRPGESPKKCLTWWEGL